MIREAWGRTVRCGVVVLALAAGATAGLEAQRGRGGGPAGPPQPAREAAPVDLTGYWVSVVTQDWRWRMMTPEEGDYGRIQLTPEGRQLAEVWDPAADEAAGEACRSYGAPAIMSVPGRLHITWENDQTLRVETDAGMQTRLLRFDIREAPADAPRSWQGVSVATWQAAGGNVPLILRPAERAAGDDLLARPRGGSLRVVTSRLRPGYLRKNGVPYSEDTVLTEIWDTFTHGNGDQWLTVTTLIEDAPYLRGTRYVAWSFKREPDGSKWTPTPCSATW
jgi:hypothetical protein